MQVYYRALPWTFERTGTKDLRRYEIGLASLARSPLPFHVHPGMVGPWGHRGRAPGGRAGRSQEGGRAQGGRACRSEEGRGRAQGGRAQGGRAQGGRAQGGRTQGGRGGRGARDFRCSPPRDARAIRRHARWFAGTLLPTGRKRAYLAPWTLPPADRPTGRRQPLLASPVSPHGRPSARLCSEPRAREEARARPSARVQ